MNTASPGTIALRAELPDSQRLLSCAQAGDAESFWALCEPLQDRLVRQALALCRDESLAQDLAQETLLAAWKNVGRYDGKCQLSTWLCSILLNKHRTALRRSHWWSRFNRLTDPVNSAGEDIPDLSPGPDRTAQLTERSREILLALERLPAKQREVIFLRFYSDESIEGIACALQCSEGTVKSRLFHALENLRRMRIFREELR